MEAFCACDGQLRRALRGFRMPAKADFLNSHLTSVAGPVSLVHTA